LTEALTKISFAAKGYWNYPEAYFEIWKDELTIGSDYVQENDVFVYEKEVSTQRILETGLGQRCSII
jgi:hypothetical protein